ncbi:MAG: threonine synthase [Gaiellales bacterium]|jgi:threonine synthase|nr:threonine synthase [Gaiellales bacterium]
MTGLIERYRDRLPVTDATPVVSLGEGSTPLVHAPRLSALTGLEVHLKYEGLNPTGSFKDRGMTVAVSKALEEGATAAVCASTGNTSASAAAYCGRAGIKLAVVLPEGAIARGKLAQAQICGARVIAVQGSFDDALRLVRELVERHPVALLNSINPYRLEGQKTAAFEVVEQLGGAPDWLALPVGNGGNITAYWKGFGELDVAPRMLAGQAAGAAPLLTRAPVPNPTTIATAIRIGNPARLDQALAAVEQSQGGIRAMPDEVILEAYRLLAQQEGVFCEPASAASVAALLVAARDGLVEPGSRVVCVLTGHGLKDPDTAGQEGAEILRCPPVVERLEELAFTAEPALV